MDENHKKVEELEDEFLPALLGTSMEQISGSLIEDHTLIHLAYYQIRSDLIDYQIRGTYGGTVMADTEEIIQGLFDNLKDFNEKNGRCRQEFYPCKKYLWRSNGTWGSDSS